MARRTLGTKQATPARTQEDSQKDLLVALVKELSVLKPDFDALKKLVEEKTTQIKELMLRLNAEEVDLGNFEVKLIKAVSNSFNTEKLISWAKQKGYTNMIKTIEVLDEEGLENYTYDGTIAPIELQPFQVEKVTYRLNARVKE